MKSKIFLAIVILFSFASVSRSQVISSPKYGEVTLGETKVSMGNDAIIIDYGICFGEQIQSCKIGVSMIVDGKPFKGKTYFSGDIGIVRKPGQKQIRYDISHQKEQLAGKDIRFRINILDKVLIAESVPEKHNLNTLLMATVSPLSPRSYGLMAGVMKKIGGYARFQSNFSFTKTAFKANEAGAIDGGGYLWPTGEGKIQTLRVTAGALFKAYKFIYPYAGAGYGYKNYVYEDVSGDWGLIKDLSTSGLALETGVVFKAGPIAISAGVSSTMFKLFSLDLGVGVLF